MLAKSRLDAAVQASDLGHNLAPAHADVPAPAAASSRSRLHPAQYFGDLLVVPPQELDLLLQILGQRSGPPVTCPQERVHPLS